MKKIVVLFILVSFVVPAIFSQEEEMDMFTVDVGGGLYYDAYPLSGTIFDFLLIIFNLRGGVHGDINYNLSEDMSAGAELGLAYISATTGEAPNEYTASLFDIPAYLFFRYKLGFLAIQPYAGLLITGATNSDGDLSSNANVAVGARLFLGGIYAEVAYILGLGNEADSFPRFGIGYQYKGLVGF